MPRFVTAQVTLPELAGVPANSTVITAAFQSGVEVAEATFATEVALFFTTLINGTRTLWAEQVDLVGNTLKLFDMDAPRPRLPFHEAAFAVAGPAPTSTFMMPPEVAICVSYRAAYVSGVSNARRRGRMYLGPLAFSTSQDVHLIPDGTTNAIFSAAMQAVGALNATELAVYSRSEHAGFSIGETWDHHHPDWEPGKPFPEVPANLPAAFSPVEFLWVDNAWDTQRRRGRNATSRFSSPALRSARAAPEGG